MSRSCQSCGSTLIDYDSLSGNYACTVCGEVISDINMTSELGFAENSAGAASVIGQFVSRDGRTTTGGGINPAMTREARDVTLATGKRSIQALISQLSQRTSSPPSSAIGLTEQAFRLYTQVLNNGYARGRRTQDVLCACIYISSVCRNEPYLLIDLAEISETNVFELGTVTTHLSRNLGVQLLPNDPSIFVHRFASQMNLGLNTHTVARDALKILQLMKRDWIAAGRRPNGVCAAALLLSARAHGYTNSIEEVAKIVKMHPSTIKDRLAELSNSHNARLNIDGLYQEQDLLSAEQSAVLPQLTHSASTTSGAILTTTAAPSSSAMAEYHAEQQAAAAAGAHQTLLTSVVAQPPSFHRAAVERKRTKQWRQLLQDNPVLRKLLIQGTSIYQELQSQRDLLQKTKEKQATMSLDDDENIDALSLNDPNTTNGLGDDDDVDILLLSENNLSKVIQQIQFKIKSVDRELKSRRHKVKLLEKMQRLEWDDTRQAVIDQLRDDDLYNEAQLTLFSTETITPQDDAETELLLLTDKTDKLNNNTDDGDDDDNSNLEDLSGSENSDDDDYLMENKRLGTPRPTKKSKKSKKSNLAPQQQLQQQQPKETGPKSKFGVLIEKLQSKVKPGDANSSIGSIDLDSSQTTTTTTTTTPNALVEPTTTTTTTTQQLHQQSTRPVINPFEVTYDDYLELRRIITTERRFHRAEQRKLDRLQRRDISKPKFASVRPLANILEDQGSDEGDLFSESDSEMMVDDGNNNNKQAKIKDKSSKTSTLEAATTNTNNNNKITTTTPKYAPKQGGTKRPRGKHAYSESESDKDDILAEEEEEDSDDDDDDDDFETSESDSDLLDDSDDDAMTRAMKHFDRQNKKKSKPAATTKQNKTKKTTKAIVELATPSNPITTTTTTTTQHHGNKKERPQMSLEEYMIKKQQDELNRVKATLAQLISVQRVKARLQQQQQQDANNTMDDIDTTLTTTNTNNNTQTNKTKSNKSTLASSSSSALDKTFGDFQNITVDDIIDESVVNAITDALYPKSRSLITYVSKKTALEAKYQPTNNNTTTDGQLQHQPQIDGLLTSATTTTTTTPTTGPNGEVLLLKHDVKPGALVEVPDANNNNNNGKLVEINENGQVVLKASRTFPKLPTIFEQTQLQPAQLAQYQAELAQGGATIEYLAQLATQQRDQEEKDDMLGEFHLLSLQAVNEIRLWNVEKEKNLETDDFDDDEIDEMILSKEEQTLREEMWEHVLLRTQGVQRGPKQGFNRVLGGLSSIDSTTLTNQYNIVYNRYENSFTGLSAGTDGYPVGLLAAGGVLPPGVPLNAATEDDQKRIDELFASSYIETADGRKRMRKQRELEEEQNKAIDWVSLMGDDPFGTSMHNITGFLGGADFNHLNASTTRSAYDGGDNDMVYRGHNLSFYGGGGAEQHGNQHDFTQYLTATTDGFMGDDLLHPHHHHHHHNNAALVVNNDGMSVRSQQTNVATSDHHLSVSMKIRQDDDIASIGQSSRGGNGSTTTTTINTQQQQQRLPTLPPIKQQQSASAKTNTTTQKMDNNNNNNKNNSQYPLLHDEDDDGDFFSTTTSTTRKAGIQQQQQQPKAASRRVTAGGFGAHDISVIMPAGAPNFFTDITPTQEHQHDQQQNIKQDVFQDSKSNIAKSMLMHDTDEYTNYDDADAIFTKPTRVAQPQQPRSVAKKQQQKQKQKQQPEPKTQTFDNTPSTQFTQQQQQQLTTLATPSKNNNTNKNNSKANNNNNKQQQQQQFQTLPLDMAESFDYDNMGADDFMSQQPTRVKDRSATQIKPNNNNTNKKQNANEQQQKSQLPSTISAIISSSKNTEEQSKSITQQEQKLSSSTAITTKDKETNNKKTKQQQQQPSKKTSVDTEATVDTTKSQHKAEQQQQPTVATTTAQPAAIKKAPPTVKPINLTAEDNIDFDVDPFGDDTYAARRVRAPGAQPGRRRK